MNAWTELPKFGYVRQRELLQYFPFSPSGLWWRVRKGMFPKPIKLSAKTTVWELADIHAWLADHRAAMELSNAAE